MFERSGTVLLLAALVCGTSLPVQSWRMRREAVMEKLSRPLRQIHETTSTPITSTSNQEETTRQQEVPQDNEFPSYSYEHLITPLYAGGYRPNTNSEPSLRTELQGLSGDEDNQSGSATGSVRQPSPCVWAIVACCTTGSTDVHNNCFEQLGCEGAWWDNPCHSTLSTAALSSVLHFYQEGGFK